MSQPESTTAATRPRRASRLEPPADFARRHVGPDEAEIAAMLQALGLGSLDELDGADRARGDPAEARRSRCRRR